MADRLAGPSTCASTVSAPFLSCVHLDPPSRAIRHPFHLKRKTCAPHHCRQHLYRPNMLLYLSFRPPFSSSLCGPLFYLFLRKIFTSFLVFFPHFSSSFCVPRGKREIHILHISLYPPPSFSLVVQHLFSLVSLTLSFHFLYLSFFFLPCSSTSRSLFSSIFRTTDFSILRIMRPFCFSLSSRKQVTNDSAFTCFECNKSFVSTCGHLQRPADGGAAVVYSFIDSA